MLRSLVGSEMCIRDSIIPTSNMVSADASGFVERALESVRSVALLRDEPAATAVACSSLVHHLKPSQSHTLFSPSFLDPMMKMEWSVFGLVDSSAGVVAASHVVRSNDGNDVDVFLSFVFKPAAVDAIIQYGDGESTHEVVLEQFRLTGGKAIPLQSYAASTTTETHTHCNGKSPLLLFLLSTCSFFSLLLVLYSGSLRFLQPTRPTRSLYQRQRRKHTLTRMVSTHYCCFFFQPVHFLLLLLLTVIRIFVLVVVLVPWSRPGVVCVVLRASSSHGAVHVLVLVPWSRPGVVFEVLRASSSHGSIHVLVLVPWSRPGVVCEALRASSPHGSVHVHPCVCFLCRRARLSMVSSMSMCVYLRTRPRPRPRTRTMVPPRCRLRGFACVVAPWFRPCSSMCVFPVSSWSYFHGLVHVYVCVCVFLLVLVCVRPRVCSRTCPCTCLHQLYLLENIQPDRCSALLANPYGSSAC